MPRVKAEPKKCIKSNLQQPPNSWVFVLKGETLEQSEQYTGTGTPDIVNLRHPNTGEAAVFLFSSANNSVQEILSFAEGKRSWFIEESVKSDGKMHLSTPIDPIFLVLPYLRKHCNSQAIPLDQLLRDDEFPQMERLLKCSGLKYLTMVADRKGDEEINAYKYNEEKTLAWLQKKTERVAEILKQKKIHVLNGAASATFVESSRNENVNNDAYLKHAHGIVSEYLMEDLSDKLLKHLNLSEDTTNTILKRKSAGSLIQPEAKVPKLDEERTPPSNVLDLSKPTLKSVKPPIQTSKEKSRSKAATGSKSITHFFKKS
ncbi:hypothetical protein RN001_007795 [Aquatica leii]|uniref:Ribonuclease H2 subunit B n=1 Tax=Aquatica leii TaxID=1421715 RepID=A0AAN7PWV4_9COLE|nr:hypothetical protein RN001_007795 [Aquatica leii]